MSRARLGILVSFAVALILAGALSCRKYERYLHDAKLKDAPGTTLVVVNSVCGCAAGKARPGVALAMRHATRPDVVATVFAGFDEEATARARGYFTGYRPSSPSIALLQNGALVYMLERSQIENRDATAIAVELTTAFDRFCAATANA